MFLSHGIWSRLESGSLGDGAGSKSVCERQWRHIAPKADTEHLFPVKAGRGIGIATGNVLDE